MLNNFIYAQTKDLFLEALNAGNILDEAIVFIEDTKEIWNHGTYFAGISDSGLDQETIDQINAEIENVRNSIPNPKDNYIDFNTGAENVTVTENEHGMMDIIVTNDVILNATGLSPLEFKNGIDNGKQLRMIYGNTIIGPYGVAAYPPSNAGTSVIQNIYDFKANNPPGVVLCVIDMSVENEETVITGYFSGFPYATIFPGIATTDQLDSKIIFNYASLGLPNESEYVLTDDQVMTACGMSATNLYNKVISGTEVVFKVTSSEGMEIVLLATNVHTQENWFAISFANLNGGYMLMYDNGTISVMFDYTLGYQPSLVSGTNIKTINGQSLLGEGDVTISTDVDLTDYALKDDIPTTTSQLTNDSGFLTEHQDISGLATKEEVSEAIASIEIPSVEGLATESWVSAEIAKAQLEGEDIDLSGYATKDDIKGLATEQFVTDEIAKIEIPTLDGYATEAWVNEQGFLTEHQDISGKVDKVDGKGLSTNDYTTEDKNKLAGIAAGAEVNVQSDWNATSGDAFIKNKPTIPSEVTEDTIVEWGFTKNTGTYIKPSTGIPKSDLVSTVQTSLNKADTALQSYTEQYQGTVTGVKINGTTKTPSNGVVDLGTVITSHQDISNLATKADFNNVNDRVQSIEGIIESDTDAVINKWEEVVTFLDGIETDNDLEALLAAKANQSDLNSLKEQFDDLTASGGEPNVQSDWNNTDVSSDAYIKNKPNLSTVATSGNYSDLSNKPTIPTDTNQLTNNAGYITGITKTMVTDALGYTPPETDTNTHYTTKIYAGATGTAANSAVADPYIKVADNTTYRNQIQIKGSGATSVSSDANGVITITSTDTNTHPDLSNYATQTWVTSQGFKTTDTDTKNTTGTTNKASTKLYLAGATSQATNPTTYSNSGCYVGTDNCLYSNGSKVLTAYSESDPIFAASVAYGITETDISNWNSKTSNTGDITGVTAGNGLTGGATSGTATLNVGAGTGITVAADSVGISSTYQTYISNGNTAYGWGNHATQGYAKTTDIPSIPSYLPNQYSLTIQKNGTTVTNGTYNGSASKTVNITVPTTVSDLSDAGNYALTANLSTVATSGSYTDLKDKPTIPSIPSNNITGSGTNGYIAKFSGANTITSGPALGTSTTTYLRNDGTWASPPNTTYTAGTGLSLSGTTFSLNTTYQEYCTYANNLNSFYEGYTTRTSLASIPVTKRLYLITISADQSLSVSGTLSAGREMHIIVNNGTTSDKTVTLPTASSYVNMTGDTLTVPASGYAEINIISDGSKMYIRAV